MHNQNKTCGASIQMSLKFWPRGPNNNILSLVQIMAWNIFYSDFLNPVEIHSLLQLGLHARHATSHYLYQWCLTPYDVTRPWSAYWLLSSKMALGWLAYDLHVHKLEHWCKQTVNSTSYFFIMPCIHVMHGLQLVIVMIFKFKGLTWSLQSRHNERHGVSNHQPYDCLLNR